MKDYSLPSQCFPGKETYKSLAGYFITESPDGVGILKRSPFEPPLILIITDKIDRFTNRTRVRKTINTRIPHASLILQNRILKP